MDNLTNNPDIWQSPRTLSWLLAIILFVAFYGVIAKGFAALIMKLYEFFIQHKSFGSL
jgi:hypothetical protein